ncbi:hypothetical protein JW998_10550 [candidate division KSB1 bacterium]|nr:hypothetical protein [candidate division KSB1 bacterium]
MKRKFEILIYTVFPFFWLSCNLDDLGGGGPGGPLYIVDTWIYNVNDQSRQLVFTEETNASNEYTVSDFFPDGIHILVGNELSLFRINTTTKVAADISSTIAYDHSLSKDGAYLLQIEQDLVPFVNPDGSDAFEKQGMRSEIWLIKSSNLERTLVLHGQTGKIENNWIAINYSLPCMLSSQDILYCMLKQIYEFNDDYTLDEKTVRRQVGLFLLHPDDAQIQAIIKVPVSSFALSTDESEIIYTSFGSIFICNITGDINKYICAGDKPQFSPAGDKIAYLRDMQLFISNKDGTDKVRLSTEHELVHGFYFFPDGTRLIYYSDLPNSVSTIHKINVDGTLRQQIASINDHPDRPYGDPKIQTAGISMQGDKVVYVIAANYSITDQVFVFLAKY